MKVNEKIKQLRELNHLSQEDMANKLHLSTSGYAKIEKGERGLDLVKLEKIATIFNMELSDLFDKNMICLINENSHQYQYNNSHNSYNDKELSLEIEKLNLIIQHLQELLAQKDKEIELLRRLTDK